jgi:hypothetical protein
MQAFLNEMCQESSKNSTNAVEHAVELGSIWSLNNGSAKWDEGCEVRQIDIKRNW